MLTFVVKSAGSPGHSSSFPPLLMVVVPDGPLPLPSPPGPSTSPEFSAFLRFVRDGPAAGTAALNCLGRLLLPDAGGIALGDGEGPSTGGIMGGQLASPARDDLATRYRGTSKMSYRCVT